MADIPKAVSPWDRTQFMVASIIFSIAALVETA